MLRVLQSVQLRQAKLKVSVVGKLASLLEKFDKRFISMESQLDPLNLK